MSDCIWHLLSKNDWRFTLSDEFKEVREQVSFVLFSKSLPCNAERLTREACGPDRSIIWPSRKLQGVVPSSNSGKPMDSLCRAKIASLYLCNRSLIYKTRMY